MSWLQLIQSLLVNGGINSNGISTFTRDLYEAMGGTVMSSGGMNVNISGTVTGNTLTLSATNATDGSILPININIEEPTNPLWSNWDWSNIIEFNTLYYVPNSFSGGIYDFQIVAQVLVGLDVVEVVLDGYTGLDIGECNSPLPCERPNELGEDLWYYFFKIT